MSTRVPMPPAVMRREPRQARSRAMVEAILAAGARVLGNRGWNGFTTNEVADVAGVSIGSLYQYFPNKLALTEAIKKRHFDDVLDVVRSVESNHCSIQERIRMLVRGMIAIHSTHPALHRILLDEVPRDYNSEASHAPFESEYLRCYQAVVTTSHECKGAPNSLVAQVISSAVEGVIHNAARRGTLSSHDLERELSKLICGYLKAMD